jgi:hypothetical protein
VFEPHCPEISLSLPPHEENKLHSAGAEATGVAKAFKPPGLWTNLETE